MAAHLTPRQARLLEVVLDHRGGISSRAVGAIVGIPARAARDVLWKLGTMKLITTVRARNHSVWCHPDQYQVIRASIVPKRRGAAAPRKSAPKPAPAPAPAPAPRVDPEETDDPILLKRQAIVPANNAPRIETRGVPSVFDLAHYA